jgi:hypothetical protein
MAVGVAESCSYAQNGRRSQLPRGLRRRSTPARLLRSWVRIPLEALKFFCYVCCVLSGRGLATSCSLVQRSPTDCGASLCVINKPCGRGGHTPRWAADSEKIIIIIIIIIIMHKTSSCLERLTVGIQASRNSLLEFLTQYSYLCCKWTDL